jgi:RNA recognition motif-containing protein
MTKLYVANVPLDATEDALRAHFAACGGVSDVELLHDRQSGRPRGLAHVTMTSPSFATTALQRLDGAAFNGSLLRVSESPVKADKEPKPDVKIVLQFREKTCLAYDLDCAGVPLTLRVGMDDETYRVEARSARGDDAVVGVGGGTTRREAVADALRAWNVASAASAGRAVDGEAVARAMHGIRAI